MTIKVRGVLGGAARVACGAAFLITAGSSLAPAHAKKITSLIGSTSDTGDGPGPLLSTYFDLGYDQDTDDIMRLTNPSGSPVCAMIYVFDTDQELQEACAVGLSPNKELSFDVAANLTSSPTYGSFYDDDVAGVIEVISATPNTVTSPYGSATLDGTSSIPCDPAVGVSPITGVNAYLEESVVVESYGNPLPGATVLEFTNDGSIDQNNLNGIENGLAFLGSNFGASGRGLCTTLPWAAPGSGS
jgi:hypothetical protein